MHVASETKELAISGGLLGNIITVRSSLFPIPVYERLGFKEVEPPKLFNCRNYQTMVSSFA